MAFLRWTLAVLALTNTAYTSSDTESLNQRHVHSKLVHSDTAQEKRLHKRSYYPWRTDISLEPQYETFTAWKPPMYQISRPYYIPVFGAPGRIPIYYPPQPLYNTGPIIENPSARPPYQGPQYLPPGTTSKPTTTTMSLGNRIGDTEDDKERPDMMIFQDGNDKKPVWGNSDSSRRTTTKRPTPTRRPSNTGNQLGAGDDNSVVPEQPGRPSTGPSRCVWAIISCCSASSTSVSNSCFEQLGCPGPFWGRTPCDSEYAKTAIDAAFNYYNTDQ